MNSTIEQRFWECVDKRGPDECWEWTASLSGNGYGRLTVNGKRVKANRISWELFVGEIPSGSGYHGMCVLHKCDNRLCVNPSHLFLGSHQDNMRDRDVKGRHARRLSDGDVLAIRSMTGSHAEIARKFGISRTSVTHIKTGRIWRHL